MTSRYGLRGVRIGEASHPGPRHKRRRRAVPGSETSGSEREVCSINGALEVVPSTHPVSGILPTWVDSDRSPLTMEADRQVPVTQIDSDEEPIMPRRRGNVQRDEGRQEVPRTNVARSVADLVPRPTRRLILVSGADQSQANLSVVDALEFDLTRLDTEPETASLPATPMEMKNMQNQKWEKKISPLQEFQCRSQQC